MSNSNGSNNNNNNSNPPRLNPADVTMETLIDKISTLEATLAQVMIDRPVIGNPAAEDSNPNHLPPKPTAVRIQYYSHIPGENFIAWRAHFLEMVGVNRWNTAEAKSSDT